VRRSLTVGVLSIKYNVVVKLPSSGIDGSDATIQSNFATFAKPLLVAEMNKRVVTNFIKLRDAINTGMVNAKKADGTAIPSFTSSVAPVKVTANDVATEPYYTPTAAPTTAPAAAAEDEGMSGAVLGAIIAVAGLIIGGGAYTFSKNPSDKKVLPSSLDA